MIVRSDTSPRVRAFVDHREVSRFSQQGPATPDHVLRTKRLPLVLPSEDPAEAPDAVDRYEAAYADYVAGARRSSGRFQARRRPARGVGAKHWNVYNRPFGLPRRMRWRGSIDKRWT